MRPPLIASTVLLFILAACAPKMLPDPLAIPNKSISSNATSANIALTLAARGFWIAFADHGSGIVNTDWRLVPAQASYRDEPVDIRDFVQVAANGGQLLLQYRAQCRYHNPYRMPYGEWTDCRKSDNSNSRPTPFELLNLIRDELATALGANLAPPGAAPAPPAEAEPE